MNRIPPAALGIAFLLLSSSAPAQEPAGPAAGSAPATAAALVGELFIGKAAGISFRAPAGCQKSQQRGVVERVVRYSDEKRQWNLVVTRVVLNKPMPLIWRDDPKTPAVDESKKPGLIAATFGQLRSDRPNLQPLREDIINVGTIDVGMTAARYNAGKTAVLHQQAIVQANDRLYYIFNFTTPSGYDSAKRQDDPEERLAVETFVQVIDSVRLLDLSPIARDQEDRLFRTRTFLVNLSARRIESSIIPEQHYLLTREGRPVGWVYVLEEIANRDGADGPLVLSRAHLADKGQTIVNTSESFCAMNRKFESWGRASKLEEGKTIRDSSEMGESKRRVSRMLDVQGEEDPKDPKQPRVVTTERYTLAVVQLSKSDPANPGERTPADRELPPYYMPQSLSHLLPRLVPINDPKTYFFYTWVSSEREVMSRFIDVELRETPIDLGGRRTNVIRIQDRIGLEGAPTWHYFSAGDFKYLGNFDEATGILMLASDARTIKSHFPKADFSRPRVLGKPD